MIMFSSILKRLPLLACLLIGVHVSAPAFSADVLSSFCQKVSNGKVLIEYAYSIDGDIPVTADGTAVLQGGKYQLSFSGTRLWNDGNSLWMADDASKELYAEAVQPTDNLSNPIFLLTRMDSFGALDGPSTVYRDAAKYKSYSVKDMTGFPDSYESISLYFKDASWFPSMIVIGLGNEMTLTIRVKSCVFETALLPESSFTVSPAEFKGYSFTDLREE